MLLSNVTSEDARMLLQLTRMTVLVSEDGMLPEDKEAFQETKRWLSSLLTTASTALVAGAQQCDINTK